MRGHQLKADEYYKCPEVATTYDKARSTSKSAKIGDLLEKGAFLRALHQVEGVSNALDVPCGTGRMMELLLDQGFVTTGCDVSTEMMGQARAKLDRFSDRLKLVEGDLRALPFDDNSFDLVSCVRLFGHYKTDARVEMLTEIARVTRKWVIVEYFHLNLITRFKRFFNERIRGDFLRVREPATEHTMRREIKHAGMKIRGRMWCRTYRAEELFMLLEKTGQ